MTAPSSHLSTILGHSEYSLTIFSPENLADLEWIERDGNLFLNCLASGKRRPAKPEEIVRQLYISRLTRDLGYSIDRIAVEKSVHFGSSVHPKAADIVVFDADDPLAAYIIVECKKPKRRDGEEQLKSYCNAEGSPIGVWTNGGEELIIHREDPNIFRSITRLPNSSQTLEDVVAASWTFEDLLATNKLEREQTTLKEIILSMENLVLANAGVDAFEEVFKLIYAKLFDESEGARKPKNQLQFRASAASATQVYERIDELFQRAKAKWPGVFVEGDRIDLSPTHLVTCVSFLQDVKLFNSNLQVIDEAFEYLSVEVGKGKKGQYFTPRHVIDLGVKITSPNIDENVIDTAAGSCGFTVHSIFHVWGSEFEAAGPKPWQAEYAHDRVYALDFDPRSIKIAKALNLIAGDGKSNVFRANTLDPRHWSEEVRVGLRPRLLHTGVASEDRWNADNFRYFDFDVLLTNPPFAGEITDSRVLHQYDLAKKPNGKWHPKRSRDVLFIERNLDFLRPGGRMAIVLPQGRLNNSSEQHLREWLCERARIVAVVGLHVNAFKPHTGTKTSLVILQKWNEDSAAGPLNPPKDDYEAFFAVSEVPGKDNSGNYVYLTDESGRHLKDLYGHPLIDHDLYDQAPAIRMQAARLVVEGALTADEADARATDVIGQLPIRETILEAFDVWSKTHGLSFRD